MKELHENFTIPAAFDVEFSVVQQLLKCSQHELRTSQDAAGDYKKGRNNLLSQLRFFVFQFASSKTRVVNHASSFESR